MDRKRDGYQGVLAALQVKRFGDWIFAKADSLEARSHDFNKLRAFRIRELEDFIEPYFDQVVEEHAEGAFQGAQAYLKQILREKGITVEE